MYWIRWTEFGMYLSNSWMGAVKEVFMGKVRVKRGYSISRRIWVQLEKTIAKRKDTEKRSGYAFLSALGVCSVAI